MTPVTIPVERFLNAELISASGLEIELRKVGRITFAVCLKNDHAHWHAFSSSELATALSKQQSNMIIDVKLLNQTPVYGEDIDHTNILRLKFANSTIITVDKYDHVYTFSPSIERAKQVKLISPHKQWGLPPLSIAGVMLFTQRMIEAVESIAEEGQHAYLVKVLWDDYRLVAKEYADEDAQISVEGEFLAFTVKRFAHGLYIFDLA